MLLRRYSLNQNIIQMDRRKDLDFLHYDVRPLIVMNRPRNLSDSSLQELVINMYISMLEIQKYSCPLIIQLGSLRGCGVMSRTD